MEDNWKLIYSSAFLYKVELVKAILEEFEINSIILNKKDSAYLFGEIELYVRQDDVIRGLEIIKRERL